MGKCNLFLGIDDSFGLSLWSVRAIMSPEVIALGKLTSNSFKFFDLYTSMYLYNVSNIQLFLGL